MLVTLTITLSFFSYFLYYSLANSSLRSFPTRRSSDLHPQHLVLAPGEIMVDLLERQHPPGDPHETDHVPRDAPGARGQDVLGPLLERLFPGEVEQGRIGAGGGDLQWCHGSILPLGGHRRPSWCVQTGPAVPNGIIAGPDGGRNGDGRPAGAGRPSPGRAGSAAQALTGLDVEEVHVALLRTEVDRLSLRRRTPAVDTSDERLGDLVRSG